MNLQHSSARPERFLQMCNDDDGIDLDAVELNEHFVVNQLHDTNWIVANVTTPANIYHLLRRQVHMPFRKPLIVMAPKSLLRHPMARSPIEDFIDDQSFKRLIPDGGSAESNADNVKRLVFCSGKLYYELLTARKERQLEDSIALVRLEQICPFPYDLVKAECDRYPNAELVWAQEESKNMGAWTYVQPRLNSLFADAAVKNRNLIYEGRKPSASPATGNKYTHYKEQKEVMDNCIH